MSRETTFDPREFLALAARIADRDDEAALRTAVGRAYYALFLIAREYGHVGGRHDVHARVLEEVRQRKGRQTADQLKMLKQLRVVADYQLLPLNKADRDWQVNGQRARAHVSVLLQSLEDW